MALVSQGFLLTVDLVDASGENVSRLRYDLTAEDFDTATTNAGTIITRLNAVTDALVKGYHLGEVFSEDAASVGDVGSEVENQALIVAKIDGVLNKTVNLRIPAASIGIFQASTGSGKNQIAKTAADLVAYLSTFETGALATISDGEHIADSSNPDNFDGKRVHRGSRRG